ncbi:hypothetical protein [Flammeovirga agarivorans]|nr:hypothetical protein [Flammeovirga agarivorans]
MPLHVWSYQTREERYPEMWYLDKDGLAMPTKKQEEKFGGKRRYTLTENRSATIHIKTEDSSVIFILYLWDHSKAKGEDGRCSRMLVHRLPYKV